MRKRDCGPRWAFLFIAIFVVGGGLLFFLYKVAKNEESPNGRVHSDPNTFQ